MLNKIINFILTPYSVLMDFLIEKQEARFLKKCNELKAKMRGAQKDHMDAIEASVRRDFAKEQEERRKRNHY